MSDVWKPGIVLLRHIDKDGKGYVSEHVCWNTSRFIETQHAAATEEGGSIEVLTETEYKRSRP